MSSSSSTKSNSYRKFVERGVKYKCGIIAPCWEVRKDGTRDPGRRFYGCSRYKDPQLKCNFFEWAEPQYTERAREVIEDLKLKLSYKCDEILSLSDDLSIADKENMLLKEQLSVAERKNKETMEVLSKETELGK
ncbi:GRF-type domain-containing protein [Heracleum sosnowskyi]|uniref:GRF-type domain-containing protein n=1 Tax=Heracleum sosnowskyi TaxID=360622 RepID=A0AAD8HWQ9_9APIA|nr:GRF-type domain-containing protein [Heracleum sosnowskyi]